MKPHPVITANAEVISSSYKAGESQKSLAVRYGVRIGTIRNFLDRNNIQRRDWSESHRRHALNQDVFDAITEESAYWIGFLMADGCVTDGLNGRFVVSLALAARDAEHVEKFRRFLGSSQMVRLEKPKTSTICGKLIKSQSVARILVTSKKLVAALASYGVTARKSFTARVYELESNRHFWRGVIDGDGWICGRLASLVLGAVGSQPMMEQLRSFLRSIAPDYEGHVRKTESRIFTTTITGRQAQSVIRELYKDSSVSLDRKKALADEADRMEFIDLSFPVKNDSIRSLREQAGLNQREAARLSGFHFTYWNMVERNYRGLYSRLARETISKICVTLNCDPRAIAAD